MEYIMQKVKLTPEVHRRISDAQAAIGISRFEDAAGALLDVLVEPLKDGDLVQCVVEGVAARVMAADQPDGKRGEK